jgi:hypothetical protein
MVHARAGAAIRWNAGRHASVWLRSETAESRTMRKFIILAALAAMASPAIAAEYYIVRGPDKTCRVVETRPTDKTVVVIGDKAYVTREEADRQVKIVCKEQK